jgi:hypothetical protein
MSRVGEVKSYGNVTTSKGLSCLDGLLLFRDPALLVSPGKLIEKANALNPP